MHQLCGAKQGVPPESVEHSVFVGGLQRGLWWAWEGGRGAPTAGLGHVPLFLSPAVL